MNIDEDFSYDQENIDDDDVQIQTEFPEDYKFFEDEEQAFGFGYRQLEQIGVGDEDVDILLGTNISMIDLDPYTKFKILLFQLIREKNIDTTIEERFILRKHIYDLNRPSLKNPLFYLLGYKLYSYLPNTSESPILYQLTNELNIIKKYISDESGNIVDIIKYAVYWRDYLLNPNKQSLKK
jgi:hypothetical protein